MDPLSEVLALLEPRSFSTAAVDAGGAWAIKLDDLAGQIKCYAVVRGSCWLTVEGGDEPMRIPEGSCFVMLTGRVAVLGSRPGIEPALASDVLGPARGGRVITYQGGGDAYVVGTRFEFASPNAPTLLRSMPTVMPVETSGDRARLRGSIELMMEELREARPGSDLIAQQLAHMMLVQALRLYISTSSHDDVGWFAALADPQLSTALEAMHADPAHPWTVRKLATLTGMSRTTFAERFRARAGETPIAYLTRWRMILASEQLLSTENTIGRIASSVGYESEHAFSTAFKREMGIPPGRYARAGRLIGSSREIERVVPAGSGR
ncbi:AraC-like DNA-binding protein [Nocardia tenerifensis]|uniref:AraC-like DNA-binding protein n=1 Tax=Nocardia tenerifensis TaxID=228006 RepID=A0A318JRQ5_9NOCA|nr:AraC family transcriptional regulator [Nocardia tenerifensis]PXX57636.1 AraC-like DNA-binding protein [Nocardia tenerifensis]